MRMIFRAPTDRRLWAPAFAAGLLLAIPHAWSQEYCVACTEPDTVYRCVIDGARPGAATSLQLLCISAMAKEGSHATCAVRRGVTVLDCNGPVKRVAIPADGATETATPQPAPSPAATASPATPQSDPKTVAEMLKRAKEQSDRDWEQANAKLKSSNEKVGSFFKKSWDCLSSLFSHCSEP